jgi:hypothetical protein
MFLRIVLTIGCLARCREVPFLLWANNDASRRPSETGERVIQPRRGPPVSAAFFALALSGTQ